jgi:hypothetical protein
MTGGLGNVEPRLELCVEAKKEHVAGDGEIMAYVHGERLLLFGDGHLQSAPAAVDVGARLGDAKMLCVIEDVPCAGQVRRRAAVLKVGMEHDLAILLDPLIPGIACGDARVPLRERRRRRIASVGNRQREQQADQQQGRQ